MKITRQPPVRRSLQSSNLPYLSGAWTPVDDEVDAEDLDVLAGMVQESLDELLLTLGGPDAGSGGGGVRLPVKGYASHGESWSFALALRLASYDLLRSDGDDPILILDDVFAELDTERRAQLAELVSTAEQVLVTAAVGADVPEVLAGTRYVVAGGEVVREQ